MATIDELRARGAILRKQINELAAKWVDDPAVLADRERAKAELDVLPAAIGEIRRREVLAHIGKMHADATALAREVEKAEAEMAALVDDNRANLRQLHRAGTMAGKLEVRKQLHASNAPIEEAQAVLMRNRAKLDGLYGLAVRAYGVFLDGSERQLLHRAGLPPTMTYATAYTERAWEEAAARLGRLAEDAARRELIGGVTMAKVWA